MSIEATRQTIADEEQKLKDDREALLDMQEKTKAKQESVRTLRPRKIRKCKAMPVRLIPPRAR